MLNCYIIESIFLKDENVIVDEECNVELIDFGSSTHYDRRNPFDTFCGTIDYAVIYI